MITIIDYGLGNLLSIKNMLKRLGLDSQITSDHQAISEAKKLILPGVGHFAKGMEHIHTSGLKTILDAQVLDNRVPVLGICLGMQLLSEYSEEGGVEGLGWIQGETKLFDRSRLSHTEKVPHMGWNHLQSKKESQLLTDMYDEPRFYFVHSYHMVCKDENNILGTANHGYEVVGAVEKDNILGVQFHPEKSHKFGMKLLSNFAHNY